MSYRVYSTKNQREIETITTVNFSQNFDNSSTIATLELYDETELDKVDNDTIIEIENENNNIEFIGKVKTINTENDGLIEIKLEEQYTELLDYDSNGRIFYEFDSGNAIESLIEEDIRSRGSAIINNGSTLTDYTSNLPVFELTNFSSLRPENYGTNLIFGGFPREETSQTTYQITIDNITPQGDEFNSLELNLLINNLSGVFDVTAQFIDSKNNNYVWQIGAIDGVNQINLPFAKAQNINVSDGLDPTDNNNQNKLRVLISVKGELVESRAIGIDAVIGTSVDIINRNHKFNSIDIPESGRTIQRRFTNTISEAIFSILEEENKKIQINEDNNVTIKEEGGNTTPLEITEDRPIVSFDRSTYSDAIKNEIIVEGDGDVYVSEKSNQSIDTFNFKKTLKVRDTSIKTKKNAIEKARRLLSKHAFKDTQFIVEMPETEEVRNTEVGDEIYVDFNAITNNFVVEEISKQSNGWTEIIIDAESVKF